jgi:transcriptional regulator with XRE-family HTH domain
MSQLRKSFGNRLRFIRDSRRMSQEEFAEFIGISVDFLSLIERGINAPSFETIEKIANCLQVPVAFLFTFEESEKN